MRTTWTWTLIQKASKIILSGTTQSIRLFNASAVSADGSIASSTIEPRAKKKSIQRDQALGSDNVVRAVRYLLQRGALNHAESVVRQQLIQRVLERSSYEALIKLFAVRHHWDSVDFIWKEMKRRELVPSMAIRTVLLDRLFQPPQSAFAKLEDLIRFKEELFSDINPDEGFFCALMARSSRAGSPPSALEKMLEKYAEKRGPGWIPSYAVSSTIMGAYVRANDVEGLTRWARHSETLVNLATQSPSFSHNTSREKIDNFTSYQFTQLRDVAVRRALLDHTQTQDLIGFIQKTEERNMTPDLFAYNVLIASEVRQGEPELAAQHFKRFTSHFPKVLPDTYTFASMFKAHETFRNQAHLKTPMTPTKLDPSPRALFYNLLQVHSLRLHRQAHRIEPLPILTTSLLRVVLRTFLTYQDYASAIVAISTFSRLQNVHVNATTFKIAWQLVVERIIKEMAREGMHRSSENITLSRITIKRRRLKPPRIVAPHERERFWAGRMLDDRARWEESYTVKSNPQEGDFALNIALTVLPYAELQRRVSNRLNRVLMKDLEIQNGSYETRLEEEERQPNTPINADYCVPDTVSVLLLKALLRRAIIMTHLPVRHGVEEGEKVFQHMMSVARKAMLRDFE